MPSHTLHFPGNARLRAQFEHALSAGRLAGSYLFEGAPGAGQEQAAIELAAGVIVGDTDLANPDARRVRRYAHPDLLYVLPVLKPASRSWSDMSAEDIFELFRAEQARKADDPYAQPDYGKKPAIPVKALRELLKMLSTRPFEGRGRALILRDADAMDSHGQDTLLKTLEEPPPGRVIVLISSRPEAMLPTVRSRCQRVPFDPLPASLIQSVLEDRGLAPARAELLATLADGSVELAVQLAAAEPPVDGGGEDGNPLLERREAWLDLLEICELGGELEMLDAVQSFTRGGSRGNVTRERAEFLGLALSWYRELLRLAVGESEPRLFVDQRERLARLAGLTPAALAERIQRCEKARAQILGNVNAQLTLLGLFFGFRQGSLARRAS
jgi:DNA polymerase-3 subunit delta'